MTSADLSDPARVRAYQAGYATAQQAWRKRLDAARRQAAREALLSAAMAAPNYGWRVALEARAASLADAPEGESRWRP